MLDFKTFPFPLTLKRLRHGGGMGEGGQIDHPLPVVFRTPFPKNCSYKASFFWLLVFILFTFSLKISFNFGQPFGNYDVFFGGPEP